ncbi:MAG: hypothetical protein WA230_23190, partial [Xanthobacteraceae bacterium]
MGRFFATAIFFPAVFLLATFFFAKAFVVFFLAKAFVVFATLAVAFFRFFFAIVSPRRCPLDHAGRQDKRRNGSVPWA